MHALSALAILGLVLLLVTAWVVRALPGIAAAEISRLTNTKIEMGAFDFHRDASVSIDGMIIRPQREELFYDDTILRAKSVYAKFSLASLLRLSPQVKEIHIEEFILDVQCDLDTGRWNVGTLRVNATPGGGGTIPTILLRGGKLRYCRVTGGDRDVAMSVPVEARFGLETAADRSYGFEIKTSKLSGGYGKSALRGTWRPGRIEVAGGLSSTDIPSLERAWAVDVLAADLTYDLAGQYELNLRAKDLHSKHSPEVDNFRRIVPAALRRSGPMASFQRFFARYGPFGTLGEIRFEASGNFNALDESAISGRIVCNDISIRDQKFPYAIDHLTGELNFTQSMMMIDSLAGKHGPVDLIIEGWTKGYGEKRQYRYLVTSDNMALDEDLYAALKPNQKRLWDTFKPAGQIGAEYRLSRSDTSDKRASIAIELKNVAATYQKFPYPLHNLTGKLQFEKENIIASDLAVKEQEYQIRMDGKVAAHNTDKPIYYISIDANDLPLDETLRQSLPEQYRALYERLDINGLADVRARVFTNNDANRPEPISFLADVSLNKASLKMDGLPGVVSDLSAEVSVTPDSVSIRKSAGRYGQGDVTLNGGMQFAREESARYYHLSVATKGTLLDETLLDMLPESIQESVAAFHPEGTVNLAVDFKKSDTNEPADYTVSVECLGNKVNHELFSYPLRDVRGTVLVDPTGATFRGFTARPLHQPESNLTPTLRAEGRVSLAEETRGQATFAVQAEDLLFTEALGQALPKALSGIYRDLSPRGPFDVNLGMLRITGIDVGRPNVEFEGRMDLKTCSLQVSGAGAELRGHVFLEGAYDRSGGFSKGRVQLAADRLTIKNKDITDLNAQIVYDPNADIWSAHNFLGRCHGGRLLGDFKVGQIRQGVLGYMVAVGLNRVDLREFLLAGELAGATEKNYTSGILSAALSLGGRIGDGSSRLGVCRVDVADMQVGKMSPLASLLAVLSLTEPADYAFERMLLESYLRRNKLLISKFDLSGQNLAFTGGGTMNLFDGELDLILNARGKRVAAAEPSLFQSLTEGLGGAVVRVEVGGTFDEPLVETKALPVIEDSLKILGTPR